MNSLNKTCFRRFWVNLTIGNLSPEKYICSNTFPHLLPFSVNDWSCGCTLFCVPCGIRGSSRPTRDGALSFLSGRESVTPRSVTKRGVTLLSVPGKILAPIFLDRVRQKLLTHQRHEQSVFTPKKSTVDRILAIRVRTERLRDFHTGPCLAQRRG